jgi:tight adherence protein B
VATAAGLGADVPSALRRVSVLPGARDLADLAAAWQVSAASGAGLAAMVDQVGAAARATGATRRVVLAELASAQATARLVAVLPLLVLMLGSGVGGDPWHFLLRTPVGLACLATGLALALTGLTWMDRIGTAVFRS